MHTMNTAAEVNRTESMPLIMFQIEMPWHPSDQDQGNYEGYFWAQSPESAIEQCADAMQAHYKGNYGDNTKADADIDDDATDYRQYGHLARVSMVYGTLINEARLLMYGPNSVTTDEAEADLKVVERILSKYADLHAKAHMGKAACPSDPGTPSPQPAQA